MFYDNPRPVPVINSDDPQTFAAKLRGFATVSFKKNAQLVGTVSKYAAGANGFAPQEISHTCWTASASSTTFDSSPGLGIDGANSASWYSGRFMAGGEWYGIDMGAAHPVAMVTVQTADGSGWNFPRGFRVELFLDGSTWTSAADGLGYGWKRLIAIRPTQARYVRIVQTGMARSGGALIR